MVPAGSGTTKLVDVLRVHDLDYDPVGPPSKLAATADLTVSGTVEGVAEGRTFAVTPDSGPVFFHVTLEVRVASTLAGMPALAEGDIVYVELMRAEWQTAEMFREAIPEHLPVVLFLDDRTDVTQGGPVTPAENIPRGQRIYSPYAEGFLILDPSTDTLVNGYVDLDELDRSWAGLRTMGDLVELIDPMATEQPFSGTDPTDVTVGSTSP